MAPTIGPDPSDSDRVCADAKANMAFVNQSTGKNGKAFFDSMQFSDQEIRKKQDAVDERSGLKNTGELSNALFSGGLGCYRFTQHSRLHAGACNRRPSRWRDRNVAHARVGH